MSKTAESAIVVKNLSKSFRIPLDKNSGLKQLIINFYKRRKGYREFKALDDVSFEIKKGEFFGIVGRNGSGKSTLLKLLAGTYTPDGGEVQINGSLIPFIELGVGFNPELTGRENVFLNGALLGFSKKEMEEIYDEIVDFAELHDFMEERLKNYSSGMQVRLAFSIAIRAEGDILVLDEVLAVGDINFQHKCLNYFKELKNSKKTVVFVSHDMGAVQDFCDQAVILDKSKKIFEGKANKAASIYNELNFSQGAKNSDANHNGDGKAHVTKVWITSGGKEVSFLKPNEEFTIHVNAKILSDISHPVIGIQIEDQSGTVVFGVNNLSENKIETKEGQVISYIVSSKNIYHNGSYNISVAIKSKDRIILHDQVLKSCQFDVAGWNIASSVVHPETKSTLRVTEGEKENAG